MLRYMPVWHIAGTDVGDDGTPLGLRHGGPSPFVISQNPFYTKSKSQLTPVKSLISQWLLEGDGCSDTTTQLSSMLHHLSGPWSPGHPFRASIPHQLFVRIKGKSEFTQRQHAGVCYHYPCYGYSLYSS